MGSLVLGHWLRRVDSRQRPVRAQVWLHGMCMGRRCWLRHSNGAQLSCGATLLPHPLSAAGPVHLRCRDCRPVCRHDASRREHVACSGLPHRAAVALRGLHLPQGAPGPNASQSTRHRPLLQMTIIHSYYKQERQLVMKTNIVLVALFSSLILFSCGRDGKNNEEPKQEGTSYPSELCGTWIYYSGAPKSILSDIDSTLIFNHVLTLTSNGNFSESVSTIDESAPLYGNWKVNNKSLVITDWNGNVINSGLSYSIGSDSILSLTSDGKSAFYYRPSILQSMYPSIIFGTWEIYKVSQLVFNRNGTGVSYSNYHDGFYLGREYTTWSIAADSLRIRYIDWAESAGLFEYKIDYLNTKYLCITNKNGTSRYSKQR